MRILFITPFIQNMYKDIESEFVAQGHQVFVVQDKKFFADPFYVDRKFLKCLKNIIWNQESTQYWKRMFQSTEELNIPFDFLFVISGTSVNRYMVERLKKINPSMRSAIYTWDSCKFYRFDRHLRYFDRGYNFDIEDVKRDSRWILLPIYCKRTKFRQESRYKYDIFSIGSNHDGRYSFIKKILPQLQKTNIRYFIKIVTNPIKLSIRDRFFLRFTSNPRREEIKEEIAFSQGLENFELLSREKILARDYDEISQCSSCVLDDQRENQSGLTARFMWALAEGKKIITTNQAAYNYDFVSHEQVAIIQKRDPFMPLDFLQNNSYDKSNILPFIIDNWIKTILT